MTLAQQKETLRRWLDVHSGIVYKVVRAYARSHHDQEDLFQEVVVQLWRAIPRFEGKARESTFMYQVALYAAMAWSRKERRRREEPQEDLEAASGRLFTPEPARDPRLDWLYERIATLDELDRSLTLLMLDGYSYRDIGQVLGLSEVNVGVKLTRVRNRLAEQVTEENKP